MEMISASKMRRAQSAVLASHSYSEKARQVLSYIAAEPGRSKYLHPLLEERKTIHNIAIILFTADRGLAGAYNVNIVRETLDFISEQRMPVKLITVGKRGRDLMKRLGKDIIADFSGMGDHPPHGKIPSLARVVREEFLKHEVDEVYVAYTNFQNALHQIPTFQRILPIERAKTIPEAPHAVYLFEPDANQVLDAVLPRFVETIIYQALLESVASEHAARMVAMRNATENAHELIDSLTLLRNKVRQTAITKEMLDIVGGAEALRQVLNTH